jgi:hypothetical protein
MTHRPQLACPVMRTAARLQRNQAARMSRKEVEEFAPRKLAAEDRPPGAVRTMRVENLLSDIQPDRGNL